MRLTNSFFLNIPRTGSVWVKDALKNACTVEDDYKGHLSHKAHEGDLLGKKLFTFIRHPVPWYSSYFAKQHAIGWERRWHILYRDRDGINLYRNEDFNVFMTHVLDNKPTFYSELVNERIALNPAFVGKTENLVHDLIRALKKVKEPFKLEAIYNTPRVNVSTSLPTYDRKVLKRLLHEERRFIKHWYKETCYA